MYLKYLYVECRSHNFVSYELWMFVLLLSAMEQSKFASSAYILSFFNDLGMNCELVYILGFVRWSGYNEVEFTLAERADWISGTRTCLILHYR